MRYVIVALLMGASSFATHWWETPSPKHSIRYGETTIITPQGTHVTYTIYGSGGGGGTCRLPPFRICWQDDEADFIDRVKEIVNVQK